MHWIGLQVTTSKSVVMSVMPLEDLCSIIQPLVSVEDPAKVGSWYWWSCRLPWGLCCCAGGPVFSLCASGSEEVAISPNWGGTSVVNFMADYLFLVSSGSLIHSNYLCMIGILQLAMALRCDACMLHACVTMHGYTLMWVYVMVDKWMNCDNYYDVFFLPKQPTYQVEKCIQLVTNNKC